MWTQYYPAMRVPSWLRKLRAQARYVWFKIIAYVLCFGIIRGLRLFLLGLVWPGSNGRRVKVWSSSCPAPLLVRLGSTDITVFNEIYRCMEYAWNFATPPGVIVDAGAYTGLSTAFFAARYPDAQIIAVEPDEQNFELLALNTAETTNVRALRAAIWAESGSASLTDPGDGAWGFRLRELEDANSIKDDSCADPSITSVPALTIADIIRDYGLEKIDLLKLDIEGSEKEVFTNAAPWIGYVEAICLELHDRFKAGCSRAFYKAVEDFPIELRRGEEVLVLREESLLSPVQG
jgi:FkbM family methyltransferase